MAALQVPARNEDLPQPRQADGSVDPRYRITEAKRYLGKLLFFDPVRTTNIRPEFGGVMSTSQTASCGSCHLGAAAAKAGTQINFAVGGEGFGYTTPDGRFVPRRRIQPGLVDTVPTPLEVPDSTGKVVMSGIASYDNDSATVLVVHDGSVKSKLGQSQVRHQRWSVDLVKVNGRWLIDDFSPVN